MKLGREDGTRTRSGGVHGPIYDSNERANGNLKKRGKKKRLRGPNTSSSPGGRAPSRGSRKNGRKASISSPHEEASQLERSTKE